VTDTARGTEAGWQVYIVQCADGTLYTGIALDLPARVAAHNAGTGARYTRSRLPVQLVYREPQPDRSAASRREYQIKQLPLASKLALLQSSGR
jgi:predicted GIY-YIG superfamily endonuclease